MIQEINNYKILKILNLIKSIGLIPLSLCLLIWMIAFLFLLTNSQIEVATIATFILLTIQLISSISDLYSKTIPLKLMFFGLIAGLLLFIFFYKTSALIMCTLGGIIAFALTKLLIIISRRQVGGGDLALMTVTGFFSGIDSFLSILFISVILAGIYSLFLIFIKKENKKAEIPFAPFVLLATVICVLSYIKY